MTHRMSDKQGAQRQMVDPAHEGRVFPEFTYTVERNKVKELLTAIDDGNPAYNLDGPSEDVPLPPTFPTLFTFWGGFGLVEALKEIDVNIWDVLHGDQAYEYAAPIHIGDKITGQSRIESIKSRRGMDIIVLASDYHNQHGELVLTERATVIVQDGQGEQ